MKLTIVKSLVKKEERSCHPEENFCSRSPIRELIPILKNFHKAINRQIASF
jgi:hypothetical protein